MALSKFGTSEKKSGCEKEKERALSPVFSRALFFLLRFWNRLAPVVQKAG